MIRTLLTIAATVSVAGSALAKSTTWEIDPAHSSVEFSVKHMMVTNVRGEFGGLHGTVTYDPDNPANDAVEASVSSSTVNTREEKRDLHLKSADFFDVANFPELTFKSKKVTQKGGLLKVEGDLTIHGVTRPVTFEVTPLSPPIKNPWGNIVSGAHATAKIDRYDYGLKWNKALEAGGVLVGQEVTINLDVELKAK